VDYKLTSNGNHTLFWRGAVRNDVHSTSPYLPGQAPLQSNVDYSKGFTAGYTATIRQNLLNNFRWATLARASGYWEIMILNLYFFRGLNNNSTPANSSLAVTRSFQLPDTCEQFRGRPVVD